MLQVPANKFSYSYSMNELCLHIGFNLFEKGARDGKNGTRRDSASLANSKVGTRRSASLANSKVGKTVVALAIRCTKKQISFKAQFSRVRVQLENIDAFRISRVRRLGRVTSMT